jgi:SAM-dependent methyltransferase
VSVRSSQIIDRDAALQGWWSAPVGRALLAAECELLTEALEDVFGWDLLQVGAWGGVGELLGSSRTRRQTLIAPPTLAQGAQVIARPALLPVSSDSMDAVLLPHTLEFAADPYAIVREADRVLVGEGQLLVLGFTPWSSWGWRARASRSGFPPTLRRMISRRRLREWLVLLGYEVVTSVEYLYCSPWSLMHAAAGDNDRALRRSWFNPLPAGAYLLKARKRIYTLTPIRPRFRERSKAIGGLVKPTTRSST